MFGKKKTEVEFTGVRVSNEKRNAIVLFVMEAIVVLIFIAGVLFALNYFNIFDVNNLFESIKKEQEPSETGLVGISGRALPPEVDMNIDASIDVQSNVPEVAIQLVNEDEFINNLKSIGVFGRVYLQNNTLEAKPASRLNIVLVSEEMTEHKLLIANEVILYSSKTTFEGENINISVYISPIALNDSKRTAIDKGILVQEAVIRALYAYANNILSSEEINNKTIEILRNLYNENKIYFRVRS